MNDQKFKKIILYGGSFDPIHLGHIKAAKLALKKIKADVVIFIVSWLSPFKKHTFSSNSDRLKMAKLATKNIPNFIVSDYEIQSKNSYFFKTIEHFSKQYPDSQLYSLIGSDNIKKFHIWKSPDLIAKKTQIIYANRPHFCNLEKIEKQNINKFSMKFIGNTNINASSTDLRKKSNLKYLNPEVVEYVNDNLLYINERIKANLSKARWNHCQRTAKFAEKLAIANKYSKPKEAYIAGLFHDLAKEFSPDKLMYYANKLKIKKFTSINTLHSFAAYYVMKYDYLFKNKSILQAVYYHTEPNQKTITKLDKIIFVADKCEPGRIKEKNNQIFNVKKMQKIAFKNIDESFLQISNKLKIYYESLKNK